MKNKLLKKIKQMFEDETFVDVKTNDEKILRVYSADVVVDSTIEEVTEDGTVVLEDGDYTLEDGMILTIVEGVITEIVEVEAETEDEITEEEFTKMLKRRSKKVSKFGKSKKSVKKFETVIKQVTKYDISVDNTTFAIGDVVTVSYEDGDTYSMYAGTYELEDGSSITLDEDGIVIMITDNTDTVTDVVEVGDVITNDSVEVGGDVESTDETEFEEFMVKLFKKINSLEKENSELNVKFNKLSKTATGIHTETKLNTKADFSNEKPKSKLHNMI